MRRNKWKQGRIKVGKKIKETKKKEKDVKEGNKKSDNE